MALLHWWPFNGDTKNRMEDSQLLSREGAIVSGGKIGHQCLKSTYPMATPITIDELDLLNKGCTFSCWIKINKEEVERQIRSLDDTYDRPTGSLIGHNHYNGFALTWFANGKPSTFNEIRVEGTIRGNTHISSKQSYLLPYDKWVHITLVSSAKQKRMVLYANGTALGAGTDISAITSVGNGTQKVHINRATISHANGPASILPCYLNDVRIYDHALTEAEVKLLAQGLVAHYPLKAPFLPNLLQGVEQYTKEDPLVRNVTDSANLTDSYQEHRDITAEIRRPGKYLFVLSTDGFPSSHILDNPVGTVENRKYSLWLCHTTETEHNKKYRIWNNYNTAKDGRHYGFIDLVVAGTYELQTNLYLYQGLGGNYTVKFWDMQLFACDEYLPEIFEPISLGRTPGDMRARLGLDKSFTQDASGYGNHATQTGDIEPIGFSPVYHNCGYFDGSSYLACGKAPKVNGEEITVSCWGYMDSWAGYAGKRLLSCTDGGGWNLESRSDSAEGEFCFAIAINKENGDAPYTYYNVYDETILDTGELRKVKDLSSGWHHFCGVFDGLVSALYIDGIQVGKKSDLTEKYSIYYNTNNGVFIGAEAQGSAIQPQSGTMISGLISDVRIYSTALSASDVEALYNKTINTEGVPIKTEFIESNFSLRDRNEDETPNPYTLPISGNLTELNAPISNMKIKTLPDRTTWARIHSLDLTEQKNVFWNNEEVNDCDVFRKYSKMGLVDEFKTSRPPEGYIEVEYIETTGSQYINTGFMPNNNSSILLDFRYMGEIEGGSVQSLFGARMAGEVGVFGMWLNKTDVYPHYGNVIYTANGSFREDGKTFTTARFIYGYNKNIARLGQGNKTCIMPEGGFSSGVPLCLFAMNTNGSVDTRRAIGRLYSCQIWDNSNLVRDFIPCQAQDGTYGLYDLITKQFYTNSGSGTLTGGRAVNLREFLLTYPSIDNSLPSEYCQLEYVESDGRQWVNTGVTEKARWEFDVKFDTNITHRQLMGYGGNHQEYWGVQAHGGYGIHEDRNLVNVVAGQRDTIVHCFGETGVYSLRVQDKVLSDFNQTMPTSPEYQLFNIVSSTSYACHAKMYGCNCIQNGQLIRKFVPALRNSDNVAGLYDLVNKQFYTSGSGTHLLAGPKIDADIMVVKYLASTGEQYINTGVTPTATLETEISFTPTDGLMENAIFGSSWARDGYFLMFFEKKIRWHSGGNWVDIGSYNAGDKVVCHCTNSYITVNGVKYPIEGGENSASPVKILDNMGYTGGSSGRGIGKIEYMRMWDNGVLIRDFIPIMKKTGELGLLDLVENKLYTNAGTSDFYTQLEYIEANPGAYIDTGFTPDQNTRVECGFSIAHNGNDQSYIYGSGANYNSMAFELYPWTRTISEGKTVQGYQFNFADSPCHIFEIPANTFIQTTHDKNGFTANGRSYSLNSDATFTAPGPLYLLTLNRNGSVPVPLNKTKLYYCRIYNGGTIVRDFIPVIKSGGIACLYDKKNSQYYDNAGSNTLNASPDGCFFASSINQYNRWIQTNSPNVGYRQSSGYQPIRTDFCRWNGSKYSSGPITKSFDQSRAAYLVSESNDPWAPIGQKELYGTGIRALNNTTQLQAELWVRIDKMPWATEVSQSDGCYIAPEIIEY